MMRFEERSLVELRNEGQKIFGILHLPKEERGPYPIVVFCHGLAGHRIGRHRMYVYLSECLAKRGIASLRFDYRGAGDSEGNFAEMSLSSKVSDCLFALKFIDGHHAVDANKIALFGRSLGGVVAVLSAHKFGKIKSLALWSPIYGPWQWQEEWKLLKADKMDDKKREELMLVNGQLPGMIFYEEFFKLSLSEELDALDKVPVLIIHGEKDGVVDIEHSKKYLMRRKGARATTEFLSLPHSDHDFSPTDEKRLAIARTCAWFKKTLA